MLQSELGAKVQHTHGMNPRLAPSTSKLVLNEMLYLPGLSFVECLPLVSVHPVNNI